MSTRVGVKVGPVYASHTINRRRRNQRSHAGATAWVIAGALLSVIPHAGPALAVTYVIISSIIWVAVKLSKSSHSTSSSYPAGGTGTMVRQPIPQDVRIAVAARDGGRCRQCGAGYDLQFDHIIPVSRGGSSSADNVQILCGTCNRTKGARY